MDENAAWLTAQWQPGETLNRNPDPQKQGANNLMLSVTSKFEVKQMHRPPHRGEPQTAASRSRALLHGL